MSRAIFERLLYDCGAVAPVPRAVAALMLLQQTRLETLKIGEANDRMRLRSDFRNALMLGLSSEGKAPREHKLGAAFNLPPSMPAITNREHDGISEAGVGAN